MWYKKKKKKTEDLFSSVGIKVKKKPDYKAKLDKIFSEFIRLRDSIQFEHRAFRCISCGQVKPYEQADCGHYINRSYMSLRFSEKNCNAQCRHCNRFKEGNNSGYRVGLISKYGEKEVLLLEATKHITRHYSDFEYKELIKYYSTLVKKMKKEAGL